MPKEKEMFWVSNLKEEIRKYGLTLHEVSDRQYVFIDKDTGEVIAPLEGELTIEEIEVVIGELGETKNVG